MKLTKEQALFYHRQMWGDIQRELGNCPTGVDRIIYKEKWCQKHFPNEHIANDCFLCEYVYTNNMKNCKRCPIRWTTETADDAVTTYCCYNNYYYDAPISEILALPERNLRRDN